MPRVSTRHASSEVILFSDFSGGLNLAKPPETIADNEMQEAVNFEFAPDTGMLRVRGGLEVVYTFDHDVRDIMPIAGSNAILVRSGNKLYRLTDAITNVGVEHIDEVEGNKPASYELWSDGHQMVVAFGGPLYLYDGRNIEKIETPEAPTTAEILLVRNGRVVVAETEKDTIRYSGVGDPRKWTGGNDSDAVQIDVGYKDGCNMAALSAIAGELIVFKRPDGQPEHGRIYRLQGEYPNWKVVSYSRGSSAWNPRSVVNAGSDILFLTREGLGNLSTATEFGDYKLGWAGAKINPKLAPKLSEGCRMWPLPIRGQVWVSDGTSRDIWCYHYQIGGGAWTTLRFPEPVNALAAANGRIYLGLDKSVYRLNDNTPGDGGRPVYARVAPKTIFKKNQTLVKGVMAGYQASTSSNAKLRVERFEMPLQIGGQDDIAFMDDDIAFLDDDPLVPNLKSATMRRRCNIRRWAITPRVECTNGQFTLSYFGLEVAEV